MKYRPEIDGLRALAVLPVVLFHAKSAWCPGGFIGVDVFFVISGFLITSIIDGEIRSGSFSLGRFYERRARRILPALVVMTLAVFIAGWKWMLPSELKDVAQSAIALMGFASNFFFWKKRDYFADTGAIDPMLHTWTLAVEEQFYVLFPLVLFAIKRWGRSEQLLAVGALIVASFVATWPIGARDPSAAFYLLPTRAWELGTGSLLAMTGVRSPRGVWSQVGATLGVGSLLASLLLLNEHTLWPGPATLLPVVGAALIIACAPSTWVGRLLSLAPFVFIGRISYSVYLWHQPLLAFGRIRSFEELGGESYVLLIGLSLLLGALSWRLIEEPIRRARTLTRSQTLTGSLALVAMIAAVGAYGHRTRGWRTRLDLKTNAIALYTEWTGRVHDPETGRELVPNAKRCWDNFKSVDESLAACTWGASGAHTIAVWGDSHSRPLAWDLGRATSDVGIRVRQLSFNACAPVPEIAKDGRRGPCNAFGEQALSYLTTTHDVDTVIVAAVWSRIIDAGAPYNVLSASGEPLDGERRIESSVLHTIRALLESGKRVVLVQTVPMFSRDVPRSIARERFLEPGAQRAPILMPTAAYRARNAPAQEMFASLGAHPNLLTIDPGEVFCDTYVQGSCVAELDQQPLYIDKHHLNTYGARKLVHHILDRMNQKWSVLGAHAVDTQGLRTN